MSRTVRYFKLIYIVAGILLSNEKICETVDRIQIAPHFVQAAELKEKVIGQTTKNGQQSQRVVSSERPAALSNSWYQKLYVVGQLKRLKSRLRSQWRVFSVWTLPNFLIECSTSLLCRTFIINSDCDVIYK